MAEYRLGLYDPLDLKARVTWIGKRRTLTPRNLQHMRAAVRRYNELAETDAEVLLSLGILRVRSKRKQQA